jgi:hypothetical protein
MSPMRAVVYHNIEITLTNIIPKNCYNVYDKELERLL